MDLTQFSFTLGKFKDDAVIWILFPYHPILKDSLLDRFPSAKWSNEEKRWYLPDTPSYRKLLDLPVHHDFSNYLEGIHEINHEPFNNFLAHLQSRKYRYNTIKQYVSEFADFLVTLQDTPAMAFSDQQVRNYLRYCSEKLGFSESKINGRINALKYYFKQVLNRDGLFKEVVRPKPFVEEPYFLTKQEVKDLFDQVSNKKHLLALKLMYGTGIRVGELVNLEQSHFDWRKKRLYVPHENEQKSRYTVLPKSIQNDVRRYLKQYEPNFFLFEGYSGGKYSIRSVQTVFSTALRSAHIPKIMGVQGLRNSFSKHLLEDGVDEQIVNELLGVKPMKGNKSILNRQAVQSPLDTLYK